jgi:conjugative transfer region protein (TIGR03748 family)
MNTDFKKILTLITMFLISTSVFALDKNMPIGRYLTASAQPSKAQQDLMSQVIQIRFPQEVQTVGDAIAHVLRFSGYSLVDETRQSPSLKNTLKKQLPVIDRNFGPMSLKDALSTLAGPAFTLMQDPLNREVNFKINTTITWRKG